MQKTIMQQTIHPIERLKMLERKLGVTKLMDKLEAKFDAHYPNNSQSALDILRRIKVFLHREKEFRKILFCGSKLERSDCLTLSIIAALLATRKGIEVKIGSPRKITHYLHAGLLYSDCGKEIPFAIAGRGKHKLYGLSLEQIERRLKLIKPIMDLAYILKRD